MGLQLEQQWANAVHTRATRYANKVADEAADKAARGLPQGTAKGLDPEQRAIQLDNIQIARDRAREMTFGQAYEDERARAEPEEWRRVAAENRDQIESDVIR